MLRYDVWITNVGRRTDIDEARPISFPRARGMDRQSETDRVLESSNHIIHMETCQHKKFKLKING